MDPDPQKSADTRVRIQRQNLKQKRQKKNFAIKTRSELLKKEKCPYL